MFSLGVSALTALQPKSSASAEAVPIEDSNQSGQKQFELSALQHRVAETLADSRLVIGGAIKKDRYKTYAALAMVDVANNSVDFAKVFRNAHVVTAIAPAPTDAAATIFALATQNLKNAKA